MHVGLNHYTSKYVSNAESPKDPAGGWPNDQQTVVSNTDSNGNLIGPQAASSWYLCYSCAIIIIIISPNIYGNEW